MVPPNRSSSESSTGQWRCYNCARLLGIKRGARFYLKHKRAQYIVWGAVMAVCPRCSHLNDVGIHRAPDQDRDAPQLHA